MITTIFLNPYFHTHNKMMEESYEALETDCPNCGLKFRLMDMKISASNNLMVCINCFTYPGSKVKRIR